jgi:hypothetical protein
MDSEIISPNEDLIEQSLQPRDPDMEESDYMKDLGDAITDISQGGAVSNLTIGATEENSTHDGQVYQDSTSIGKGQITIRRSVRIKKSEERRKATDSSSV